jgi:hypothetical protein
LGQAAVRRNLIDAQVAEVDRSLSGAVKTEHKRGPNFRAPFSGYGLRQHRKLIPRGGPVRQNEPLRTNSVNRVFEVDVTSDLTGLIFSNAGYANLLSTYRHVPSFVPDRARSR